MFDGKTSVPAVDIAREIWRSTREQAEAARAGDWETAFRLTDFRQALIGRLNLSLQQVDLSREDRMAIVALITEVQSADCETTALARTELHRVGDELRSARQGRSFAAASSWATATSSPVRLDRTA